MTTLHPIPPSSLVADPAPDVLVVEDDIDIRELVTARLRRLGCHVRQAATGEAGLEQLAAATPDLLVLDVLLPGVDGWEVLHRVRSDAATAGVPVLVLSIAGNEPPNVEIPPGRYLPKPFSATVFTATVRHLLGAAS